MRFFVRLLLIAALPAVFASAASAQGWKPTKDVEFVIPFGLGGGADLMARMIHKIIVEDKLVPVPIALVNKGGGGGAVGHRLRRGEPQRRSAHPDPDQRQHPDHADPQSRGEDADRSHAGDEPDARRLPVLRARRRALENRSRLRQGREEQAGEELAFSTGGTTDVMAVTVLSKSTGVQYNTVSFNSGGEALTALLGGHVQASMGNPLEFMGQLQGGKIRALGVVRDQRFPGLKDVPTFQEQGIKTPNFQMWRGIAIPKGAPEAARAYWEGVMTKVNNSPQMKKYYEDNVAQAASIPGKQFEAFLANQEKLYRDLLGK